MKATLDPMDRHTAALNADKVMPASEAVAQFVRPGAVLGMGGQNIGRCPMALAHEIIRQRIGDLTVVGCNLSIAMDQLVGAGLVTRCVCGSGNLERFGTTFCWRRGIEEGTLEVEDYSHLAMVTRFLAGEMGVPVMPTRRPPGQPPIPFMHTGAVVVQPFGAYPTSAYRYYDFDADEVGAYQLAARTGAEAVGAYLRAHVWGCATFEEHLARAAGPARLQALQEAMRAALR